MQGQRLVKQRPWVQLSGWAPESSSYPVIAGGNTLILKHKFA